MKTVDLEPFLAEFGLNSVKIGLSVKNWSWRRSQISKTRLQCRFLSLKVILLNVPGVARCSGATVWHN